MPFMARLVNAWQLHALQPVQTKGYRHMHASWWLVALLHQLTDTASLGSVFPADCCCVVMLVLRSDSYLHVAGVLPCQPLAGCSSWVQFAFSSQAVVREGVMHLCQLHCLIALSHLL
jgi:hypothetical protein